AGGGVGGPPPLPSRGPDRRRLAGGADAGPGAAGPRRGRGGRGGDQWGDPSSTSGPHLATRDVPAVGLPQAGGTGAGALIDPGAPGASGRRAGAAFDPGAPGASARRRTGAVPGANARPSGRFEAGPAGAGSTRRLGDLDPGPPSATTTGGRRLSGLDSGAPAGRSRRGAGDPGAVTGRHEPLLDPGAPGASGRRQAGARPLGGAAAGAGAPGAAGAVGAAGAAPRTGEHAALGDRLDGLVARATPPHGHRMGASAQRRDPRGERRPAMGTSPADELPPTAPVPIAHATGRGAPGPGARPAPAPPPGRAPYDPAYDEAYDDHYGDDGYDDSYGDAHYDEFDEDEPTAPEHRPGCSKPVLVLAGIGVFLVLVLLVGMFWVRGQIDPGGEPGDPVRVEIVAGQSTSEIGSVLEEAGVIKSATLWPWYVRFKGGGDIQAGVYEIPTNLSMGDALAALEAKPLPPGTKRVTIPEGQTIAQIRERVTASENKVEGFTPEGFDAALADPSVRSKYLPAGQANLEGTFYPETYDLAEDATEVDLLQRMRDEMDGILDELDVTAGAQALGITPYEVLIVASIVEEEAKVDEDRPKIARVIYNRMANGEALYIDAINCYEKRETPCRLTDADFETESPYNSRKTRGLPPTPIAAPRRASIEAALHPADGPWTFYVLDPEVGENRHFFTDDVDEFNAAKVRCRDAGLGCG
ncbi:MAG TPA: endolytic transglycosylase MltG, partial [Acidimicrobiales bacterium]